LHFDASLNSWVAVPRDATTTTTTVERRANWAVAQIDGAALVAADEPPATAPDADVVLVWCGSVTAVQVVARLQQLEWSRQFSLLQHVFAVALLRHRPHAVRVLAPSHSLMIDVDATFAFVLVNAVPDDDLRAALRAQIANAVVCWPELKDAPQGQEVFGDDLPQLKVV
jgi:hypothetical protein